MNPPSFLWCVSGALLLVLPLPSRRVSPNAQRGQSRGAALAKARHVKAHRFRAWAIAKAATQSVFPFPTFAGYSLSFHWPTAAYRDDDNADASCKAYRDGIASALAIDDRHLRKLSLSSHHKDKTNPRLEILLHPPCNSSDSANSSTTKATASPTSSSLPTSPRKASTEQPPSAPPQPSGSRKRKSSPPAKRSHASPSSPKRATQAKAAPSATPSPAKA